MKFITLVAWGTFDIGKPRNRILLRGLDQEGIKVIKCHIDIWAGVEDKSQLPWWGWLSRFLRLLIIYPILIWRYFFLPAHDAVLCLYPGLLDVLIIRVAAWSRCSQVYWDMFLSAYDTIVENRGISQVGSLPAELLWTLERIACAASDMVFLDTRAHAERIGRVLSVPPRKLAACPVGVEEEFFSPAPQKKKLSSPFTVLFYGQFIPLHGIDIIIRAARMIQDRDPNIVFILIGRGQEQTRMELLMSRLACRNIQRILWVPYQELAMYIGTADVCLGIFSTDTKAASVIPNKAYQVLACGRLLVTGDTPAMRDLNAGNSVVLVPTGNAETLAETLICIKKDIVSGRRSREVEPVVVNSQQVARAFLQHLSSHVGS